MPDKKTKILYLTTTSQLSGAEKMLYELASRLDKEKYAVMVCTIIDDLGGQLLDRLRKKEIKTACLKLNRKWKVWRVFKLIKIIKGFNPDILQSFLFFDNILGRIFGRFLGVSVIISGQRNVESYRSGLRNFFDKVTLPLADCVVSNTRAGKKILIRRERVAEEKVKVIYNGISISKEIEKNSKPEILNSKQILNSKSQIQKIGFVGSLTKQKGLSYLMEAVAQLKDEKIQLIIIGDGKEKEKLKNQAKRLGIDSLVFFAGRKENAWQYMKAFDLFILPSLWEGMPNVILEAMSQKVPVVASKVGGVPELIEDRETGFLVKPKNSKALADKIKYVLNLSQEERTAIGERAKKVVMERFSFEKMVGKYQELYETCLTAKMGTDTYF